MRNFKEILQRRIEEALDYGFNNHIPLTSDYLAEKLLATLDKLNGELKQMERQMAQIVIMNRITIDRANFGGKVESDYDKWVDEQDAAMEMAADMLLDPIKHLTPEELRKAYEIQQHNFDIADINDELDTAHNDYVEQFGIDKKPVTADELDDMACKLCKMLNNDECGVIADTVAIAIANVLRERNRN